MTMQAELVDPLLMWIVALPLGGALFNGLLGARLPRAFVGLVACSVLPAAFILAALIWMGSGGSADVGRFVSTSYTWLDVYGLRCDVRLVLDACSVLLVFIICGVGSLIHLFSWGYMAQEAGWTRYFAYLNLFCSAMLLLVLADSLPVLFIGWEGVGLCSYLLIAFDHHDRWRVAAATKAFIVNRVGDAAFLLAMFILVTNTGKLDFVGLANSIAAGHIGPTTATVSCLLIGLAVAGKSAQIPLYVWLPDAMAGPTPVSALIHAATMVTAGIYLLARLGFLLALAPVAMAIIATSAAVTALFSATIALAQNDIKKVLAYSTISQLGYMVMAAALGAAPLALLHVTTHAFFKACLFLGAGAVIHAQAGEQDMRRMGGLARAMPLVALSFGLSTLALCGVPPLSGFVSKDAILAHLAALALDSTTPFGALPKLWWLMAQATAGLTALYMGRLVFRVFFSGPFRGSAKTQQHLHDAPLSMALPLCVLAALATVAGSMSWPHALGGRMALVAWISPVLDQGALPRPAMLSEAKEYALMALSSTLALLGLAAAAWCFNRPPVANKPQRPITALSVGQVAEQGWAVDSLYSLWFARPFVRVGESFLVNGIERHVIQGLPAAVAKLIGSLGFVAQLLHSGNLQRGAAVLVLGAALLLYGWLQPVSLVAKDNAQTQSAAESVLKDKRGP